MRRKEPNKEMEMIALLHTVIKNLYDIEDDIMQLSECYEYGHCDDCKYRDECIALNDALSNSNKLKNLLYDRL